MPITNILKVSDYINTEKNKPYKTFNSAYFKFKMGSTCLTLFIVEILNFFFKSKKKCIQYAATCNSQTQHAQARRIRAYSGGIRLPLTLSVCHSEDQERLLLFHI